MEIRTYYGVFPAGNLTPVAIFWGLPMAEDWMGYYCPSGEIKKMEIEMWSRERAIVQPQAIPEIHER